jgi:hypothetical protein
MVMFERWLTQPSLKMLLLLLLFERWLARKDWLVNETQTMRREREGELLFYLVSKENREGAHDRMHKKLADRKK